MRAVPSAIAVVSAVPKMGADPRGLLVSSFNSVEVSPIPYVSFNIRSASATLEAIKTSGSFHITAINSPDTADIFAGLRYNSSDLKQARMESNGRLKTGNGTVIWMRCKWSRDHLVEVGSHAIIVGEVLEAGYESKENLEDTATIYWQRSYNTVARGSKSLKPTWSSGLIRKVPIGFSDGPAWQPLDVQHGDE